MTEFDRAVTYVETEAKAALTGVENFFSKDVDPLLVTFFTQFLTDFGKAALKDAAQFVEALMDSSTDIKTAGNTLLGQLKDQGITTAEQDAGTVVMNALRVQLTNAQITAS